MSIELPCPCGKTYRVRDELAGQSRRCPACQRLLCVPQPITDQLEPLDEPETSRQAETPVAVEEEEIGLVPLEEDKKRYDEEEENAGTYGVNAKESGSAAGVRGAIIGLEGAVGCFKLSQGRKAARGLAFSRDCRLALAALDDTIYVLNVANGGILRKFKRHENAVHSAAFSADGRLVISGDAYGSPLLFWEAETGKEVDWFKGHKDTATSVAFAPDGRYALSGSLDGTMRLWDIGSGKQVDCFDSKDRVRIHCVAFSPGGNLALAAGSHGSLHLWEVKSGHWYNRLRGARGDLTAAAFSPDGRRIVAARHKRGSSKALGVWQWQVKKGRPVACFTNPPRNQQGLSCMALSPNGRRLVAAGQVTTNASSEMSGGGRVAHGVMRGLSPLYRGVSDVRDIFTQKTSYYVYILNVETGQVVHTHEGHERVINSLIISPDSSLVLSAAEDGTVRVWGVPL